VPPPKKAVLSWLTAAPNVEGGRLKWGFSWVFNQLNEYKQNHMKGRQRGRNGGGGGGKPRPPGRNPNFDGGGNNRPRGNAQQLMEKYLALARDASSAGDRVLAENYFQHADHYYRVLNARFEQQNNGQRRFDGQGGQHQNYDNRQGGYGNGPYDDQPQHGPGGGYPQHQQQPQQHHNPAPAPEPEPEPQQAHDAEIALPAGILGEAPRESGGEPQDAEGQQEGGDQPRERGSRDRGRRRRGRGDRSFAGAAGE